MKLLSPLRLFQGERSPSQMFLGAERTLGSASWDLAVSLLSFALPPFPLTCCFFSADNYRIWGDLLLKVYHFLLRIGLFWLDFTRPARIQQYAPCVKPSQSFPHAVSPQLHPIKTIFEIKWSFLFCLACKIYCILSLNGYLLWNIRSQGTTRESNRFKYRHRMLSFVGFFRCNRWIFEINLVLYVAWGYRNDSLSG